MEKKNIYWYLFLTVLIGILIVSRLLGVFIPFAVLMVVLFLFALPGLFLSYRLFGEFPTKNPHIYMSLGLASIVMSVLVNSLIVRFFGWQVILILVPTVVLSLISLLVPKKCISDELLSFSFGIKDYVVYVLILSLVLLTVMLPLLHLGEEKNGNHYYYSLLSHDYLLRGVYSTAVLRDMPPKETFMANQRAINYFLTYFIIAASMKIGGLNYSPECYVTSMDLMIVSLFILVALIFTRSYFQSRKTCFMIIILGIYASSYHGIYTIIKNIVLPDIPTLQNMLDKKGLLEYGDTSHGWYRDFLVEPQACFAILLIMAALTIEKILKGTHSKAAFILIGLLLGGAFASDSFLGMAGILCYFVIALSERKSVAENKLKKIITKNLYVYGTACLFIGLGLSSGLCSLGSKTSYLVIMPYKIAWKVFPVLYPLSLGPMFIGILILFIYKLKKPNIIENCSEYRIPIIILVITLVVSMVIMHNDKGTQSAVFRKSLKLAYVGIMVMAGVVLDILNRRKLNNLKKAGIILLIIPAIITFGIDVAIYSGYLDFGQKSTISNADYTASTWLRENVPIDAIVQSLPEYYAGCYYPVSPVAMIGGHAMALGNLKIARINSPSKDYYSRIINEIQNIFHTADITEARNIIKKYNISYIYIGPNEKLHKEGIKKYYENEELFKLIYSNNGVDIFRIIY